MERVKTCHWGSWVVAVFSLTFMLYVWSVPSQAVGAGSFFFKKEQKVKVTNGPNMPASVRIENDPNVAVMNEVSTQVTNTEENPVPVKIQEASTREELTLECSIVFQEFESPTNCIYGVIPEGQTFIVKFVTAEASDSEAPGIQFSFIFNLNGEIPYIPPPTITTSERSPHTVVSEPVYAFVPGGGSPSFQYTRSSTMGSGRIDTRIYGYLVDRSE